MNAPRGARPVATLPAVVDPQRLRRRLAREEDRERRALAEREDRVRRFADVERPAYESWLRLELGPALARLDEQRAALRARELVAARVSDLVELEGWHPREALYLVEHGAADDGPGSAREGDGEERDAIDARRRAKRQRKRAERREARRREVRADAAATTGGAASRSTELYRGLARRLHPDSPDVLRTLGVERVRAIWAEVQSAYGGRNVERLLALSAWIETAAGLEGDEPGATDPLALLSFAERHDRLRALRRARTALDRRLAEAAADPAWGFVDSSPRERRRLRKDAARRVEADEAEVARALAEAEDWLAAIGPARPPRRRR